MTDYELLCSQAEELTRGIDHVTANLANLSALVFQALDGINWAGFYSLTGDKLVLGPFQGKPACVILPLGKGVCSEAVTTKKAVNVPDVHAFPGHIACDSASRSEIVLPIRNAGGEIVCVLDIDSPLPNRFASDDERGLKQLAQVIERMIFNSSEAASE